MGTNNRPNDEVSVQQLFGITSDRNEEKPTIVIIFLSNPNPSREQINNYINPNREVQA